MSRGPEKGGRQTIRQIFLVPALLAVLSSVGLISALLEDGIWDLVSGIALSIPVAVFVACAMRGRLEHRR